MNFSGNRPQSVTWTPHRNHEVRQEKAGDQGEACVPPTRRDAHGLYIPQAVRPERTYLGKDRDLGTKTNPLPWPGGSAGWGVVPSPHKVAAGSSRGQDACGRQVMDDVSLSPSLSL